MELVGLEKTSKSKLILKVPNYTDLDKDVCEWLLCYIQQTLHFKKINKSFTMYCSQEQLPGAAVNIHCCGCVFCANCVSS